MDIPVGCDQSDIHFYRDTLEASLQTFSLRLNELQPIKTVAGLQARLNNLGFAAGPVDGIAGCKTRAATREFQAQHDLVVDGISGPNTQQALRDAHGS